MQLTINRSQIVDIKYIRAEGAFYHLDDCDVDDPNKNVDWYNLPFVKEVNKETGSGSIDMTINIDTGKILIDNSDYTFNIYYKTVDNLEYTCYNKDWNIVGKFRDYTPLLFSQYENGFGDYMGLNVGYNGRIEGWNVTDEMKKELVEYIENARV